MAVLPCRRGPLTVLLVLGTALVAASGDPLGGGFRQLHETTDDGRAEVGHAPDEAPLEESRHGASHETRGGEREADSPEHVSGQEVTMSAMLLAIVFCLLTLSYFVQNSDVDVRAYTWDILSKCINIYLAVNVYFGLQQLVMEVVEMKLVVDAAMIVVFILVMQLSMMVAVHAKDKVVTCKTFGGVSAHLLGFAMLHFWANIQGSFKDLAERGGNPKAYDWAIVMVVPVAFLFKLVNMRISRAVRRKIAKLDMDILSPEDVHWLSECYECEIEGGGMSMSFVIMQVLRYYIGGTLPNAWGSELRTQEHGLWEVALLVTIGLVTEGTLLAIVFMTGKKIEDDMEAYAQEGSSWWIASTCELLVETATFVCGWAMLISSHWFLRRWIDDDAVMRVRVSVAMNCTYTTFGLILLLDRISDRLRSSGSRMGPVVTLSIISMLGIIVGFSWERCFDHASEVIAHKISQRIAGKTGEELAAVFVCALGAMVFIVAMPAMLWFINPIVISSRKAQEQAHSRYTRMRTSMVDNQRF
mmetsp:Transcript_83335/g.236160  ORF Transcript_83335/g.236160 Transcript_83335/m.236160 type:complete len:528 (-) Transcript_83335:51-1634(-)